MRRAAGRAVHRRQDPDVKTPAGEPGTPAGIDDHGTPETDDDTPTPAVPGIPDGCVATATGTETVKFYAIKGGAALLTKESAGLAFVTPIKIAEKGVYFPNGVALAENKRVKSLAAAGKQVIRIQAAENNTFDKAASVLQTGQTKKWAAKISADGKYMDVTTPALTVTEGDATVSLTITNKGVPTVVDTGMKVVATPTVTSVKDGAGRYVAAPAQGATLDSYSIKIKGTGFNATKENNTVKIGGVEATVTPVVSGSRRS